MQKLTNDQRESDLVLALRKRQRAAQEDFLRQYSPALFANIARMVGNDEDAKELTQDALLRALRGIDHFNPSQARLHTWLWRIGYNCAVNFLRRRAPQRLLSLEELSEQRLSLGGLPDLDAMAPLDNEDPTLVNEAIDQLPPDDQQLLWLFYYDDLPLKEIAFITSQPTATVATRLHRLRKRLKTIILKLKNQQ